MIITGLSPGEEIGMIDSNRPNPNLITFRGGQLRAVAAGVGASYSSLARDYDGTYSAQRQELVEQWVHYAVLTDEFVGQYVQPVWQDFVLTAHLSGVVPRPRDVDPDNFAEACGQLHSNYDYAGSANTLVREGALATSTVATPTISSLGIT
jgi:capsid protein